jgi:Na+-driven multidrug efflux pump
VAGRQHSRQLLQRAGSVLIKSEFFSVMKVIFRLLLMSSSIGSLLACLFVALYDHVGILLVKDDTLKALTQDLLGVQWLAFGVPLTGFIVSFAMRKSNNVRLIFLLSQFFFLFGFVWPLTAIFIWQVERIKVVN